MQNHDNAYKHLFSHPQAVEQLLQGFVHEDWVALLDYSTLEKVSGSYVTDDLRDREDDIIWRIRMQRSDDQTEAHTSTHADDADSPPPHHDTRDWLYVYLLLEFQSSTDAFMAVRMLTYIGLLYQDLIKSGQLQTDSTHPHKLPAVFPLVLYNGERPWNAARDMEQLIEPGPASLMAYRPRLRYFLLDEGRVPESQLPHDNAIAHLVRLERSDSPQDIARIVQHLAKTLHAPHNLELRRALIVWINRMVLRRFPLPGTPADDIPATHDLNEVHHMIGERIETWSQQLVKQGKLEGKLEGQFQGQAQALQRLLTKRFGPLPDAVQHQINSAQLSDIEVWFDLAVDAPNLLSVFKGH